MDHYYSERPESELKIFRVNAKALDMDLELLSAAGIFSAKEADKASLLLIENAIIKDGWEVLDLGCGNGIIGIAISKAYHAHVTMSDINERAIMISKRNVKSQRLDIKVIKSDSFDKIEGIFDTVLLNPPQNAGRKVCEEMISSSFSHLKKGGLLQLVARHNKGGRQLSLFMQQVFGNVRDTVKEGGFRVYVSEVTDK
jgi:16S rRNA (guanine1207-N2)-methyltransferase